VNLLEIKDLRNETRKNGPYVHSRKEKFEGRKRVNDLSTWSIEMGEKMREYVQYNAQETRENRDWIEHCTLPTVILPPGREMNGFDEFQASEVGEKGCAGKP